MSDSVKTRPYRVAHPPLTATISKPGGRQTLSLPRNVDKLRRQPDPLKR